MNVHAKQIEYGIRIAELGPDRFEVSFSRFQMPIMVGPAGDAERLVAMIDADCQRCIDEITADGEAGTLDDYTGDLDAVCDANVFVAGGRSDGEFGDEKLGWSAIRTRRHVRNLLAHGVIGKGVEVVDPDDTASSNAFTGFQNAVSVGVTRWLDGGHLSAIIERRLQSAPSLR